MSRNIYHHLCDEFTLPQRVLVRPFVLVVLTVSRYIVGYALAVGLASLCYIRRQQHLFLGG